MLKKTISVSIGMKTNKTVRCAHTKMVPLSELKPHPRNPNKHPHSQLRLLAKILTHQGWRSPIVVSNRSGLIVAGHGRLQAAILAGLKDAPVDYQDFESDEDELAHLVADNRIAEIAEIDSSELASLLSEIGDSIDIELTGFESLMETETDDDKSGSGEGGMLEKIEVIVECKTEDEQKDIFTRLSKEGLKCRLLTL